MKYKYPKKVTIGSEEFKVIYDKNIGGGEFSLSWEDKEAYIKIGMKHHKGSDLNFINIVLHEITEIVHVVLGTRFKAPDNDSNYHFCYNHREHTTACEMISSVLKQFIK